ncbi:MAG: Rpn family recombination-promoting nuclease/putative transposase [Planctomycetaceae bacterium]|jgi:predicted transposase/invertase (TIGR01784 family)|nr:Rpn family recombination-promoting nuclease/putative transposase [Planctomycetaceae bacterium]
MDKPITPPQLPAKPQREPIRATADTFIHYLFASRGNEALLLSFVNSILHNAGQPPVKSTEVQNPFNPKTFLMDKRSVIDIKAIAKDDRQFVIEFQTGWHSAFVKRMLYGWAKTFCSRIREGEHYDKLITVVEIVVTHFLLFGELEKLHNVFRITSQDTPEFVLSDDFQIHTLELITKKIYQIDQIENPLKSWLTFFWFADKKSEEEMNVLLQASDPHVQLAHNKYIQFCQDEKFRQIEDARQQYLHDYTTDIEDARKEGETIGMEKGIEKGIDIGMEKGIDIGIEKGIATLSRILTKRFGNVPTTVIEKLHTIKDFERLSQLTDISLDCPTLKTFENALQ